LKPVVIIVLAFQFLTAQGLAQEVPPAVEQQLEDLTDLDQAETEDDSFLQKLVQYRRNPINLNVAEAAELRELRILTDLQIGNFLAYRGLLGSFVNIYELQAIPTWDVITIKKLIPFITIGSPISLVDDFGSRFKGGNHSLLFRLTQVLEKSKGFDKSTSGTKYLGGPLRFFLRYRYNYKNLTQFGIVADKDAGEQFFKGAQSKGFDFYSFHYFTRNLRNIRLLALGDFTVNMGQGLIQWQSLAFRKSVDVMAVKRQAAILQPYNSAGEFTFNRGGGITFGKGRVEATLFASLRHLSANFVTDTANSEEYITSFQTSGNHRTEAEIADRNRLRQISFGGNIKYTANRWQIGVNAVNYQFSNRIQKQEEPYNLYAIGGKSWYNLSIDYSYTYKNIHFFGESATDKNFNTAFLNGLLVSLDSRVDFSLVHRAISKEYQAINGNAFTENTYPNNERGLYAGITIRPAVAWRLDAYSDIFKFPWLKSQVDAPSYGKDFLAQLTYTPNRQLEIYTRIRNKNKQSNQADNVTPYNYLVYMPRQNWRTQLSYTVNPVIALRNRVELVWFDKKGENGEKGFLTYFDILYKPMMKPFAATLRLQYFETDGYDSRIYAYENDVLYSYSIPAFYDKGYRYYVTVNYNATKNISLWVRLAQTLYPDKSSIGSGLDEITGNRKTELKLQGRYLF